MSAGGASTYVPMPGSIPDKAIALLKSMGEGAELSTAELADRLGQPAKCMVQLLHIPKNRGALVTRREMSLPGGPAFWRLARPDEYARKAPAPVEPEDEDEAPLAPITISPPIYASAWFPSGNPEPAPAPPVKAKRRPAAVEVNAPAHVEPAAAEPVSASSGPLRVALWSDGQLVIERAAGVVQFSPDETRQIFKYLDHLVTEGLAE